MNRREVADRLVKVAQELEIQATEVVARTKSGLLREAVEAYEIFAEAMGMKTAAAPRPTIKIDRLPGLSPMQCRAAIDRVVGVRQEIQQVATQFEAVLKRIKGLEAEEDKGIEALKEAAKQMRQKEKYLIEAEKGLLEFTAFVQDKRPGVMQMIGDMKEAKPGEKAGDFFERIGKALGDVVKDAVEVIYRQTVEDLTHHADAVRGLKIIEKTASVKTASLKKAGIADAVVALKNWLAGKISPIAQRIMGFAGTIKDWVQGFILRTTLVEKAKDDLLTAIENAKKEIDAVMA